MGNRILGAVLLLLFGVAGLVAVYYVLPFLNEREQKLASDSAQMQSKVIIALDNWAGYFILRSPLMKQEMRKQGIALVTEDDGGDTSQRMNRLRNGSIQAAGVTIDSFLDATAASGLPGVIVLVIDESRGGDAILARKNRIPNLDSLRDLQGVSTAFTPNSPSHYLLKAASHHFSLPALLPPKGPLRIETKGSPEALERLLSKKADIAAVWEPEVTRGLSDPGIVKILGTESTEKLIVDVLAVSTSFWQNSPETVEKTAAAYFKCLKDYRQDPALLKKDASKDLGVAETIVETTLMGIRWINLSENAEEWFGIKGRAITGSDGLVRALDSTVNTMIHAGDFASNPMPGGDSYRAINSKSIETLFKSAVSGFTTPVKPGASTGSLEATFPALTDSQWESLSKVGTLKIDPVIFQPGSAALTSHSKEAVDQAVELLRHYPTFRIMVKGHTGTSGDPEENRKLSQERAESVARYLQITYRIDSNRIRAVGMGGSEPLTRMSNESQRAYEYRLPRVEPELMRENL